MGGIVRVRALRFQDIRITHRLHSSSCLGFGITFLDPKYKAQKEITMEPMGRAYWDFTLSNRQCIPGLEPRLFGVCRHVCLPSGSTRGTSVEVFVSRNLVVAGFVAFFADGTEVVFIM